MAMNSRQRGAAGEKLAWKHLKRAGYRLLDRNFICPGGELDLICTRGDEIVFVEVKTRADADDADPENNITPAKKRQLLRVARHWLTRHRSPDMAYRFDAVSVVLPESGRPTVRHMEEIFVPVGD
jgi:putative endonuclease